LSWHCLSFLHRSLSLNSQYSRILSYLPREGAVPSPWKKGAPRLRDPRKVKVHETRCACVLPHVALGNTKGSLRCGQGGRGPHPWLDSILWCMMGFRARTAGHCSGQPGDPGRSFLPGRAEDRGESRAGLRAASQGLSAQATQSPSLAGEPGLVGQLRFLPALAAKDFADLEKALSL
jgi:hypothetical protein